MPEWVIHARKFIALDKEEFLEQAIATCEDPEIREFLQLPEIVEGFTDTEPFAPLAERLENRGRKDEAAVVQLLGWRVTALAASSPEALDEQEREVTHTACAHCANVSRQNNFRECEAAYAYALGTQAAKLHRWSEARRILERAVDLLRAERRSTGGLYAPELSSALNSLGIVLRNQHEFEDAARAFQEALAISRELAREDTPAQLPDIASTLSNLGITLRPMGNLGAAKAALSEALDIERRLAARDPQRYLPKIVMTLNNLGIVLAEDRSFPEACEAFSVALDITREHAKREPGVYLPEVARTLNNMGSVLQEEGKLAEAYNVFAEGLQIRRKLAEGDSEVHLHYVASSLHNVGRVLRAQRWFAEACGVHREALETRRRLAERSPLVYLPEVVATLNDLGNDLKAAGNTEEAVSTYAEALKTARKLMACQPGTHEGYAAMTLGNLGCALAEEGELERARGVLEEALSIYRKLGAQLPQVQTADAAGTLNDLGNVLLEQRDLAQAREAFEEAAGIYRELVAKEPNVHRQHLAGALNNLGNVLEEVDEPERAWQLSLEAVEAAEAATTAEEDAHLAKGNAPNAYRRLAAHLADEGEPDRLFRCLAAIRERAVRALDDDPEHELRAAEQELKDAGHRADREAVIIVSQSTTRDGLLLWSLVPDRLDLAPEFAPDFRGKAVQLFDDIQTIFHDDDKRDGPTRRDAIRKLGGEVWELLPDSIKSLLDPQADHDVLISGDPYWTMFPWEALCFGDGKDDFLGLHRPLTRWTPLTAPKLAGLTPDAFGGTERIASVICAHDTSPDRLLIGAKQEAQSIGKQLSVLGYELLPDGSALIGKGATREALCDVLTSGVSLVHYTGHGDIVGNEEVLILWDELGGKYSAVPFGRKELNDLRVRTGTGGKLLGHGPLVVLNSCFTGRVREFGGQREDLAAAFLEEGAQAVIASPMPVSESMGKTLGELLYNPAFSRPEGMAWTFFEARKRMERAYRDTHMWPTWALMHYHGNPYAQLPHIVDKQKAPAQTP